MGDPAETDKERLAKLEERIRAAKQAETGEPEVAEHYSQAQQGWRMVTELVSGIVIGFAMGYGLDTLFGTMPIFLVVFTLLGFVAGVRVMLRTARELQENEAEKPAGDDEEERTWRNR